MECPPKKEFHSHSRSIQLICCNRHWTLILCTWAELLSDMVGDGMAVYGLWLLRMGMYDYIDPRTLLLTSEDLKKSLEFWLHSGCSHFSVLYSPFYEATAIAIILLSDHSYSFNHFEKELLHSVQSGNVFCPHSRQIPTVEIHADMFRLQWFAVRMETENLKIPDSEYTSIYYHNPSNKSASGVRCFW